MVVPEGIRQGCSEFYRRFASVEGCAQVWGLQEVPRAEAGWKSEEHEGWTFLQHRAESVWRGTAVGFRTSEWSVLKRKVHERGFWVKMRHAESGVQMRMGTAHFTQGSLHVQHVGEVQSCLSALPPTALPVFLAADTNANIGWNASGFGDQQAFGKDGKAVAMLDVLGSREMQVVGVQEDHARLPTSRPRKTGVQGKVIDVLATARAVTGPVWIEENSCHIVGADHELIMCTGHLQKSNVFQRRFDCRPRVVVGELPAQQEYNQHVVKDMAARYTRVAKGRAYKTRMMSRQRFGERRYKRQQQRGNRLSK